MIDMTKEAKEKQREGPPLTSGQFDDIVSIQIALRREVRSA
jgi:hypothetical protein